LRLSSFLSSALIDLQIPNNSLEYTPSQSDVGRTIVFRYTPVNSHGLSGDPVSASTPSPVELSPPELADVAISGALIEGGTVAISSRYIGGGTEGKTKIQWLKSKYPKLYGSLGDSAVIEIGGATTEREFPIPVDVIGWFLGAKVTPVRHDGVAGAPVYVAASEPVVRELLSSYFSSSSFASSHLLPQMAGRDWNAWSFFRLCSSSSFQAGCRFSLEILEISET
jgi:hypothetical protein